MLTVVIRPAANPDRPMPLKPGVTIEARRLLLNASPGDVPDISKLADYRHTSFECVKMHPNGHTAAIVMKSYQTSVYFVITLTFPFTRIQIGDDCYTIEFADLMPHGKETP